MFCPQHTQYLTAAWDEIGAGDTFFHTLVCRNMKVWRLVFFIWIDMKLMPRFVLDRESIFEITRNKAPGKIKTQGQFRPRV